MSLLGLIFIDFGEGISIYIEALQNSAWVYYASRTLGKVWNSGDENSEENEAIE